MDATKSRTVYMNIPMIVRNDVEQKCKNMFIWDSIWVNSTQKHIDFKTGAISAAFSIPVSYTHLPEQYRAYTSVRGVIKLKLPGINLKPGQLNEEGYQKAIAVLDEILPGRESNEQ